MISIDQKIRSSAFRINTRIQIPFLFKIEAQRFLRFEPSLCHITYVMKLSYERFKPSVGFFCSFETLLQWH